MVEASSELCRISSIPKQEKEYFFAVRKNQIQNLLVIMISVGGAFFCGRALKAEIESKATADGLIQAGIVAEKQHTVKRKLGDNMVWDQVDVNEKLYWNDSIQTSDKSQVEIKLSDGGKISLG